MLALLLAVLPNAFAGDASGFSVLLPPEWTAGSTETIGLKNDDTTDTRVSLVAIEEESPWFSLPEPVDTPFVLHPGDTVRIAVALAPGAPTNAVATLVLQTSKGERRRPFDASSKGGEFGTMKTDPLVGPYWRGTGRILDEKTHVGAGLDKAATDAAVKRYMAQIRYCYQRELAKDTTLHGVVTVRFVVAPDGTVRKTETTENTVAAPAVASCVQGVWRRFQFPPTGGADVTVTYGFEFAP